ncbi:hypothetical protein K1719_032346 [Acacia pycnantha]|nr:hypothetical protein K1719_032346 [Acacia pycnantha]
MTIQVEDYGVGADFDKVLNPAEGIGIDVSDPLCPRFVFEDKEKERLMKPFGRTVVVKLLGRQPSYGFMHTDDYMEALTGGPWVINDAYLNVARWKPEFSPKKAQVESVVAWVRFLDLPAPLFDKKFLLNLGNVIGKAIRLDVHTAQRARGKFVRMCVELDLTKPLVPQFEVEGQCGIFGHRRDGCEEFHKRATEVHMDVEVTEGIRKEAEPSEVKKELWQIVQRPRRQRMNSMSNQVFQNGSRFSVLGSEVEGESEQKGVGRVLDNALNLGGQGKAQGEGSVREQKWHGRNGILGESKRNFGPSNPRGAEALGRKTAKGKEEKVLKVAMRYKGAGEVDKENLNPGNSNCIQNAGEGSGMVDGNRYARMEEKDECRGRSIEIGYATPVLGAKIGAASKGVAAVIRDMKKRYKLDMAVILEPRISGRKASKVIRNWGFMHSCRVETEGFSGGIWILWELEGLVVDVLVKDEQFLHCKLRLGGEEMVFTAVYASPNEHRRSRVWNLLHRIASETEEPWLLAGDFNDIKTPLEQRGGGRIRESRCNRFNSWIQDCSLIDMEANGPFFTWRGPKWDGLERVYRRLDRCLCNQKWQERFEDAEVSVIPRLSSDHHPILVSLHGEDKGFKERNFKFEAMWLMHDQFGEVMNRQWLNNVDAHVNLVSLKQELIRWNKEVVGWESTSGLINGWMMGNNYLKSGGDNLVREKKAYWLVIWWLLMGNGTRQGLRSWNNTNPEDLLPFDPEIERTILTARRVVSLSHKINTELDTELHSDCDHSDCVHSVDLSDSYSDSIPDSLVVFTDSCSNFANSDVMAERQADHATLKELGAPDVNYQPLCIQYPNLLC